MPCGERGCPPSRSAVGGAAVRFFRRAECLLVSQIGAPITEPAVAELRCELGRGEALRDVRGSIEAIVARELAALPGRLEDFVHGRVALF